MSKRKSAFVHQVEAKRTCTFSPDRKYRYKLTIHWNQGKSMFMNFIMLNPSTADELKNDPTVERCERRARSWGYDGVVITNLFAWRSTDPDQLGQVEDPVGADNDDAICEAASSSLDIVCAWGVQPSLGNLVTERGKFIRQLLDAHRITPYYLKLSKDGEPCHPLYLPYTLVPTPWLPNVMIT